ncbi:MAG: hypothetical protein H6832_10780 [Planctomycetes bacterium]|nr:hypothetical protein [Planctomycetota bacterium]MCB9891105.1 hypothetical protein [Planctomycetota bacterium]MCB9918873.1 hypothetical protein [Planctomycetota bacterium]
MKQAAKRLLKNLLGVFFILVGIVFGPMPIVQGWPFIFLGVGMIEHPWKQALHRRFAEKSRWYRRVSAMYLRTVRRMHHRRQTRRAASRNPYRDATTEVDPK